MFGYGAAHFFRREGVENRGERARRGGGEAGGGNFLPSGAGFDKLMITVHFWNGGTYG